MVLSVLLESKVIKNEEIGPVKGNAEGKEGFGLFECLSVRAVDCPEVVSVDGHILRCSHGICRGAYQFMVHVQVFKGVGRELVRD